MQALFNFALFSGDISTLIANLSVLFVKGTLVLSATWIMAYALRGSAAAIRYMVWCTGLLSLMMLPVLSSVLPAWEWDVLPAAPVAEQGVTAESPAVIKIVPSDAADIYVIAPAPEASAPAITSAPAVPSIGPAQSSVTSFFAGFNYHWTTWAFIIWVFGVFVASTRLLLAHAGATLLVRKSDIVHDEDWHLLSEKITNRLGIDHFVRLRKSSWTSVPMSVGIWRSTVILPENANEWDENQRRTVLFHELAHVKRKDCLWQLLTQITCALYWFNPLVWVAAWQLRIERERACDDLVLTSGIDASKYAQTLLQTARQLKKAEWSTLATVSMARQSQLEGRLLSILDPMRRRDLNKASGIVTVFMIALIVVPLSILEPANAQEVPPEIVALPPLPPAASPAPEAPPAVAASPVVVLNLPPVPTPHPTPTATPTPTPAPFPEIVVEIPPVAVEAPVIHVPTREWEHEIKHVANVSVDSLTIDQIIQLRKYGIDANFINSIKALGYENLTYRDLIGLGKYGANADYIQAMKQAGYTSLQLSDYAGMSKYGVNPAFVSTMQAAGYSNISADELIGMSKYGVDTRLVETLKANGYQNVSIDELISASKYGVSQDLIETLSEAGISGLSVSELVSMSKYGVNGNLINLLDSHGYSDLNADELVAASKYGVSEGLIKSLAAAGYNDFSIDELVSASKYGVGDRLIAAMRSYGYENMSSDALISASKYGVSERLMQSLKDHGYQGIPIEDVVAMSKYGVDSRFLIEMKETGLDLSIDELIRMRKYGVDAEYIQNLQKAGLEDISVEQLIDMRKHGVDAEFIRSLRENN